MQTQLKKRQKKNHLMNKASEIQHNSIRSKFRKGSLHILRLTQRIKINETEVLKRPRVHILMFHHVFPDEESNFIKLVNWLHNTGHYFISYSEAIERVTNGKIDKPFVSFSFDDGLASNLKAAKILTEYGAKAIFFLNPKIIGETNLSKVEKYCNERLKMPLTSFLSWEEGEQILKLGHEIGNHTLSHCNIDQISSEDRVEEIEKGRELLQRKFGIVKHFAWPYGRWDDFNKHGREIVFKTGHLSCASAVRGSHVYQAINSNFCVRRESIVGYWPIEHSKYFIIKSALNASLEDNNWGPIKGEAK